MSCPVLQHLLSRTPLCTSLLRKIPGYVNYLCYGKGLCTNSSQKIVKVAVIGEPNAGKSTLVNCILGRRVNSVSKKAHTTRRKTLAVLNNEDTQLIFVDTPGFVSKSQKVRCNMASSLLYDAYTSVTDVDIVVAVHDAYHYHTRNRLSYNVQAALKDVPPDTKTVLVLNKVDLIKDKSDLLPITRALVKKTNSDSGRSKQKTLQEIFDGYKGRLSGEQISSPNHDGQQKSIPKEFDAVFMVSALQGVGIEPIRNYLLANAKLGEWEYDRGFVTDQSLEEMIAMCIKEKMLNSLAKEIPYEITPIVDVVNEDESGLLNILVTLPCPSRRLASNLMGQSGAMIRSVAVSAEHSLAEALDRPVYLKLLISNKKKKRISG